MWRITVLFVVCLTLCQGIRVPTDWNDESGVNTQQFEEAQLEKVTQQPIYNEYFQYTAKKPQFAIDVAASHDVQSPEKLYKSHPIKPHTGLLKPELGQHHLLNSKQQTYQPYQQFVHNTGLSYAKPVSTSYEVYHPYKAEQPALKQIYKDPVLDKIRNDLRNSKYRLQNYENAAGESDIKKDEYLESPQETDRKKLPQKNVPAQFEIHRLQRHPTYYRVPPRPNHREQYLNHKLRHPWNQNIKVTPMHYRPVKNHIHNLRQQHALKYDDDQNEYPQLPPVEKYAEPPEGYDIYEKGKATYGKIRNDLSNSVNRIVPDNKSKNKINLEHQNTADNNFQEDESEEEFVPIKNYAQVRKFETTKHVPRIAALEDADNFEEIQNAPRLREAIKSTKAQIVYSEEGYEDAGYDHAGEQKHASDHESHGGYLKENEISGGKYKIPSVSSKYDSAKGSELQDQSLHKEEWNDDKKEKLEEDDSSDYSEEEDEYSVDADVITDANLKDNVNRDKRKSEIITTNQDSDLKTNDESEIPENIQEQEKNLLHNSTQHDVKKRETVFKIPEFDFNSTLPSEKEILKLSKTKSKQKTAELQNSNLEMKYPYYTKGNHIINKHSPLRYAENFALIPKKSQGGTEFYDSRSKFECPEVEDEVDPIPEKLKKDGHPDDSINATNSDLDDNSNNRNFEELKNKQRLKGLGDKIDCFKAKYFGSNPLDSPFFKEEIIEDPEPVTKPNLKTFEVLTSKTMTHPSQLSKNDNILLTLNKENKNNNTVEPTLHVITRHKRATPFMYEPYKIIRDSQVQDSKKTTTTSNISPLIKQLQSSRVIDKVITADKEQNIKKNKKVYKDIDKVDRLKSSNDHSNDSNKQSFVDVSSDQRGEPRYELLPSNHKPTYSPVENKKAMSVSEYKVQSGNSSAKNLPKETTIRRSKLSQSTARPFFDVSKYLPQAMEAQDIAASTNIRKVIRSTTAEPTIQENLKQKSKNIAEQEESIDNDDDNSQEDEDEDEDEDVDDDEDDDDGDDDDDADGSEEEEEDENDDEQSTSASNDDNKTTTTTMKAPIQKRTRGTTTTTITTTTTMKPSLTKKEPEPTKLRIRTRLRNPQSTRKTYLRQEVSHKPIEMTFVEHEAKSPKYTEKKRKSTKSTLVTDTKTYGDEDDEIMTKEVDALIGVKQNMDEYTPKYEKENNEYNKHNGEKLENDYSSEETVDDDYDYSDESKEDAHNENIKKENNQRTKHVIPEPRTTSEPTKRTLLRTTIAPATTTASKSARLELYPITEKKRKIEIHNELPSNRSSPHVSQFKQDIKEVEIIKEMAPRRKPKKNIEVLNLFKDENLIEQINKLGDVEVFRENLNVDSGPKHGGNYRSISPEELAKEQQEQETTSSDIRKGDVETSETGTRNLEVDLVQRDEPKNAKILELQDVEVLPKSMHDGNLRTRNKGSRQNSRNGKYIELDEEEQEDETTSMHGGNFKSQTTRNTGRMHGGNYRNAKIVQVDTITEKRPRSRGRGRARDPRTNAAVLLDGFARAAPVLTTPPTFILDPSKRMYYYVDA